MQTINLRKYYPEQYPNDCLIEVTDEVAAAMKPRSVEDASHLRRMRRNKVLSLDAYEGIENHAARFAPDPEELFMRKMTTEQLQEALEQLTPIQRRRVHAHFLLGKNKAQIAREENVTSSCICESIAAALRRLKRYYEEQGWTL